MKRSLFAMNKKKILWGILWGLGGLLLLGTVTVFALSRSLPSFSEIAARKINQSTKIYDRTGSVLLYEISGDQKRTVIPFAEIPQYAKDATIAIEDEQFYSEPAFDWKAMLRALAQDLLHGHIVQGGSTITQQLAKNAFLSDEQTVTRKIKELLLAIRLNEFYSKDQILELYLNEIPYGPTSYGIESASQAYFNKSAKDLTLAQAALLAAIPKAPSYYSPWGTHTKELIARQGAILKKMQAIGKITNQELAAALKEKITFEPQLTGIKAPHFVMAVQDYLIQKYGEDEVRNGGLRVVTTLDWNLEQIAEKAVLDGAKNNEALYRGKNASLVAEDPKTGQILALVGSRDYFDKEIEGNFDVATQGLRQPGSTLKPFIYMAAFEKGFSPDTVLFDVPTEFSTYPDCPSPPDFTKDITHCFHPQDFEGDFVGPIAMRDALAQSRNVPAVKTLYLVGLQDAVTTANRFGLTTLNNPDTYGLSLVLGGGAIRLVDLVGAYSALAQDGVSHPQTMVVEVRDNKNNVLESYKDNSQQLVDPEYPRLINQILSDSSLRAPLFQNSLNLTIFPDHDVALKTGTSNDYRDAWTVGYTPSLVIGVWAGNNDNAPMQKHGSSILAAVPIWHNAMAQALTTRASEAFTKPDPLVREKPVLRGEYVIDGQVHSILYYVDRNDPQGPPPHDPSAVAQFQNWESGVINWASVNIPNFQTIQGPSLSPAQSSGTPLLRITSPQNGTVITEDHIAMTAEMTSATPLTQVRVYWNGELVTHIDSVNNKSYSLSTTFTPSAFHPQNLLEVEAVNDAHLSSRGGIILYKQ